MQNIRFKKNKKDIFWQLQENDACIYKPEIEPGLLLLTMCLKRGFVYKPESTRYLVGIKNQ